jgi:hypothetical protein
MIIMGVLIKFDRICDHIGVAGGEGAEYLCCINVLLQQVGLSERDKSES